jgi:hypothetical protein
LELLIPQRRVNGLGLEVAEHAFLEAVEREVEVVGGGRGGRNVVVERGKGVDDQHVTLEFVDVGIEERDSRILPLEYYFLRSRVIVDLALACYRISVTFQ